MGATDFTPIDVFKKRAHSHLHDTLMWTTSAFVVKFDSNFDEFSARVAFALRRLIVYRTDGGRFARGLVRANGDLANTHADFIAAKTPNGASVRLLARLYRRRAAVATDRWVLSIEFARPTNDIIRADDDEPIVASAQASDLSRKGVMDQIIHDLIIQFSNGYPGIRGDHLRRMIALADRLGYPRNWDLWYYKSPLVFDYIKFATGNGARKAMTTATGGKFPFDGNSGYPHGEWRIYPFRDAVMECYGKDRDMCRNHAGNILIEVERQMHMTFRDMNNERHRLALIPTAMPGQTAGSSLVLDFLDHITALSEDPDSLYSIW